MDDIEAIKQLKARYFRALDTKDWAAMRAVYADDIVVDTAASGGSVIAGADCHGSPATAVTAMPWRTHARDAPLRRSPKGSIDHWHTGPVWGQPTPLGRPALAPAKLCDESPLAGMDRRSPC